MIIVCISYYILCVCVCMYVCMYVVCVCVCVCDVESAHNTTIYS
jgi:hypothetical protein